MADLHNNARFERSAAVTFGDKLLLGNVTTPSNRERGFIPAPVYRAATGSKVRCEGSLDVARITHPARLASLRSPG